MARRRMFSLDVVDTDIFQDMPLSSQCLYFHFGMKADDAGFINNAKTIIKLIGCTEEDLNTLIEKGFIIQFDNGLIVIKHWKINNVIRADRYKETMYLPEKKKLEIDEYGIDEDGDGEIDYYDDDIDDDSIFDDFFDDV